MGKSNSKELVFKREFLLTNNQLGWHAQLPPSHWPGNPTGLRARLERPQRLVWRSIAILARPLCM
jgi:hypothetical protein